MRIRHENESCFQTNKWLKTTLFEESVRKEFWKFERAFIKVAVFLRPPTSLPPSCGLLTLTSGKVTAVQTESLFDTSAAEYKRRRGGRRGGKNRLKIVSIWQHVIEFPGLWKFTLIIQRHPSVILPYMHSFAWKYKWLQLIYIILLLNWHGSGESGLGKLLGD